MCVRIYKLLSIISVLSLVDVQLVRVIVNSSQHNAYCRSLGLYQFQLRQIRNPAIFGNSAKSGFGQIFRMPVQLLYTQLSMDKTNAADLRISVFTISGVNGMIKIQDSLLFHKFRQKLANKGALKGTASL